MLPSPPCPPRGSPPLKVFLDCRYREILVFNQRTTSASTTHPEGCAALMWIHLSFWRTVETPEFRENEADFARIMVNPIGADPALILPLSGATLVSLS